MANTYTPTYNLILPEVGSDTNAWGTHLNTDLTTIDSNMLSRSLTSSQTMAGALNLPSNGLNVGSGQIIVSGGNVSMSGQLSVTGATTISNTLSVGSNATVSGALAVTGTTTLSSTLNVTGATTLAANGLNVGSGQLNVTGGNVAMSGNLTVTGTITSAAHTASALTVSGAASVGTTLGVTGATTLSSTLAVTGATTMTGNLTVQSGASERTVTLGNSGGYFYGNSTTAGWRDGSGNAKVYWDTSGNFTAAANITAYSDERLKENIQTIDGALGLVGLLRGVNYRHKATQTDNIGVIAQEVQRVLPQIVHEDEQGYLSVGYCNLSALFIEAIKELTSRVQSLEAAK